MMSENAVELYERLRAGWPDHLDIIGKNKFGDGVLSNPSAFDIYRAFEEGLRLDDNLSQLAIWAFYQVVDEEIKKAFFRRQSLFLLKDVTFKKFDMKMMENLSHPAWAPYRYLYRK